MFKDASSIDPPETIAPTYTTVQLWIPESVYSGYDEYIPDSSIFEGKKKEEYFYLGEIHAQSLNNTSLGHYTFHNCEWVSEPPSWTDKLTYICDQTISEKSKSGYLAFYLTPITKISEPQCLDNTYSELFVANSGGHRCKIPIEIPEYEGDCYSDDLNPRKNAYKLLRAQKEQFVTAANELKSRMSNLSSTLSNSSPCSASKITEIGGILGFSSGNFETKWLNKLKDDYAPLLSKISTEIDISINDSSHIRATKSRSSRAAAKHCYKITGNRNYRIEIDEDILAGARFRANASVLLGHEFGHAFGMKHKGKYDIKYEPLADYLVRIVDRFQSVRGAGNSIVEELEFSRLTNNPYILQELIRAVGKKPCVL